MPDYSISVSGTEDYTGSLKTISKLTAALGKDTGGLSKKLDVLTKDAGGLNKSLGALSGSGGGLPALAKQSLAAGDAARSVQSLSAGLDKATEAAGALEKQSLKTAGAAAGIGSSAGGAILSLPAAGTGAGGGAGTAAAAGILGSLSAGGASGIAGALIRTGAAKAIIEDFSTGAEALGASLGGAMAGNMASSAAKYAGYGALVAFINPIAGALVAGFGLVSGALSNFSTGDEAFKSYSTGLYDSVTQAEEAVLASGQEGEGYGGDLKDALQTANSKIGDSKTLLEDKRADYQEQAYSALLLGTDPAAFGKESAAQLAQMNSQYGGLIEEYNSADTTDDRKIEIGAQLEAMKKTALAIATNEYNTSDAMLAVNDTEIDLKEAIRDNTLATNAHAEALRLSQEDTKGILSVYADRFADWLGNAIEPLTDTDGAIVLDDGSYIVDGGYYNADGSKFSTAGGYARGLPYVPYDDFPALLHQGERVLTAAEARNYGGTGDLHVTVTGNTFGGAYSAQDVGREVARQVYRAVLLAAPAS